jgi:archaellum component FlaG (FlaF/FlaG flagellin family)
MKKILLSAVALVAAMSMNAQVFQVNGEAQGLTSEVSDVAAGKVWGAIDGAVDITNAFATQHKLVDCKNNDYIKVLIDGNEILTSGGVQGNDNPKDADGNNPALTLKPAVSGAVIQLDAKKDGWIYIVAKLSTNKQYMVFEEGAAMGYKIAMEVKDDRISSSVLNLEIKGEGEFNYIPEGRQVQWVIKEYLNDAEATTAGNGLGVIYFPVAKDCKYLAHATGSKISWSGIYFSENEAASIKVAKEDGTDFSILADPASVNTIKADAQNGAAFNAAGQQVGAGYKGLVIKDGKKFFQK